MNAQNRPAAPRVGSRHSAPYERLVKACRVRGLSREDAQDAVQEAHRRLLEYQRVAPVRDAPGILRRIVINISINCHHREQRAPGFESVEKADQRGVLIDRAAGPERTLAAEQELDALLRMLKVTSLRACQIYIAHHGGYSYEEIGAAFVIKPRTVEKHVAATQMLTEAVRNRISQPRPRSPHSEYLP